MFCSGPVCSGLLVVLEGRPSTWPSSIIQLPVRVSVDKQQPAEGSTTRRPALQPTSDPLHMNNSQRAAVTVNRVGAGPERFPGSRWSIHLLVVLTMLQAADVCRLRVSPHEFTQQPSAAIKARLQRDHRTTDTQPLTHNHCTSQPLTHNH